MEDDETTALSNLTKDFKLYPNPCENTLHFQEAEVINILSLEGTLIRSFKAKLSAIDVSFLSRGYYLIELKQGAEHKVYKFFKK